MILNLKALKAVALFCSKEETRYYLKGVNLQFRHDHIIMTATNGHYLTMLRQKLDESLDSIPPDTIVPIELIDRIKLSKHSDVAELYIEAGCVTVTYQGVTYSDDAIKFSFPDTRRIIPSRVSNENAQFDAAYPALYQKAAKMFRKDAQIKIAHNGENAALVDWFKPCDGLQAFGVLMPMRARSFAKAPPEWADDYIPVMMQAAE